MADIERIRVYQFCPRCGAEAMSVRNPQLVVCGACDSHLYYNPCAATGVILLDAQDRVLFVRRAKDPGAGKLGVPGGFIDTGESAEAGLRREILEEVGLEVGALHFLCSQPNTYPYRGVIYATLDFYFVARVEDFGAARPLDGVAGLVTLSIAEVRPDDFAFTSAKAAWEVFCTRRLEFLKHAI